MGSARDASDGSLQSMTGYADGRGSEGDWTWTADIRSVNGRGLDLRLRLPDWIAGLEPEARKLLQSRLTRGSVTMSIRATRAEAANVARLNAAAMNAALNYIRHVEEAANAVGLALEKTRAADILAMRGVLDTADSSAEDTSALRGEILKTVRTLVEEFEASRESEGSALREILLAQLGDIEALTERARSVADDRLDGARAALERNLARLLEVTTVPDEARLTQEMALLAVKNDVTEEMDRLDSHIAAARALISDGGPIGRRLDFLMQEFNREANTLCSKAQSAALSAVGLDLKGVIDQMREQVQNVE